MLWLLVIMLIGGLSFVIFHKPHVNSMGAGWTPPERRSLPAPKVEQKLLADGSNHDVQTSVEEAVTARMEKTPAMPDTFDFNDLYGSKKQPPNQPNA